MKNPKTHIETLVYPGVYLPLYLEDEVEEELKHFKKNKKKTPAVNVIELSDTYKIEMIIPGVKRESFCLHADGNVLTVSVVQVEDKDPESGYFQVHEFNNGCFDRRVVLPENADTEFVSAEYQSGILRLHIPKVNIPCRNQHTRIVVY